MTLTSIITCPNCGRQTEETMPTEACQFFYVCPHCGTKLRPKAGDCCVFCSYGDRPCPSKQPRPWSTQHERCVDCGTTERPHQGYGHCARCYQRKKRRARAMRRDEYLRKKHPAAAAMAEGGADR